MSYCQDKHVRKNGVLRPLLKAGRVGVDERWFGSEFQIFGATDENDLKVAMGGLRKGTHIDKDEEDRSDRTGAYRGMSTAR